jgi:hypothetical protein
MRVARIAAAAGATVLGMSVFAVTAAGPAAGGEVAVPAPVLFLEKQVVGTPPAGAEYVIDVFCTIQTPGVIEIPEFATPAAIAIILDTQFVFGAQGGIEEIPFDRLGDDETINCDIFESETGGAIDVTPPQSVVIDSNVTYFAYVENVFDTPPPNGPATTPTVGPADPVSPAAVTRPRFAG